MRAALWTAAGVLFVVMLYLFLVSPQLSFDDTPATVECGSVAGAGWPEEEWVDTETVQHLEDHIPNELLQEPNATEGILRDCDQRRTTYTGFMALLAVPTVLLGAVALRLPRKAKPGPRLREEARREEAQREEAQRDKD